MEQRQEQQAPAPAAAALGYLRPKAAAKFLGIGMTTLWEWARTKEGFPKPLRPTEGVTLFSIGELDAWVRGAR